MGSNKNTTLLTFSWSFFSIRLEIFVFPRKIIESLASQQFLCFSSLVVCGGVFFSFILLRTSGQEDIQLMYIRAPVASPNTAVKPRFFIWTLSFKPDFYTDFILCQVALWDHRR